MKQPIWLRCLQYFIISVVTFEVVIQVECAEYRTIDVVGDGSHRLAVGDRRSDNGDSDTQVGGHGQGNEFSPRSGSLDIRSRFWSDTGISQPDYPEEPEEVGSEVSPAYATLSADNGEYVSNLEERSDRHAYVTVDRDRKNKEHLVTISMPRMSDKTHLFKKFVIQPVIQYVVQYDKASGRRRVTRNGRGDEEEEQREEQKNFADYEGYQGQDKMKRGHGAKIDSFFNDINANFDTFWGNDGNGGGGGYKNGGGESSGGYQNNGGGGGSSGGYQSNGGGGGSSGGYQSNAGGGGSSGGGFSLEDGGTDGGYFDFSDGGSEGGYDTTSQMHQPPEVNAFVSGGGYGVPGDKYGAPGAPLGQGNSGNGGNTGEKYGPPGTDPGTPLGPGGFSNSGGYDTTSQMHQPPEVNAFVSGGGYGVPGDKYGAPGASLGQGNSGNSGNTGDIYGPPGTDPGTPLGPGSFSSGGNAGGMTLFNAMQISNQNQQQNNPSPMYGLPGMMSGGGGSSGNGAPGQMMMNMGMGGPSSSFGAPGMVQMNGMGVGGMSMGIGGMSQVAPLPMMQANGAAAAQAQGMMGSMPMSIGPATSQGSSFVVSGMSAGQPMVTSQLTPQQMMMMPMSVGGGAMQQQSMAQGGIQMPMSQGQQMISGGMQTSVGQGQQIVAGGMQTSIGQGQQMISGGIQTSVGQGQQMVAGGMQVPTGQGQSTAMGGAVNQGNMGINGANVALSSGVSSVSGSGMVNGAGAGTAMGSSGQQMGGMTNSNANAAAMLMQSMHAQSAALGAIGALTSQMNANSGLGANVQSILMGMGGLANIGNSMNIGGAGAAGGSSGAGGSSVGASGPGSSYGPPQELKAPGASYGPPKEIKEPSPSYGPPKGQDAATSEPQGGYGGSGMSGEDQGKGRGKKPGGMMGMGGRGKGKGAGRGGKSLFSSFSLPKLPMIPTNLGGHLSLMFSTGFGKGKRGGKMMTGGGGGSSKPSASEGKPIDQEQVSDHILNILGLTVHHPPRHSMLHSNQSASSSITNSTSPIELWEQQGNFSSLNHLTSLMIQAGTLGDVVAHLPVPDAEVMNSSSSSNTTEQPPTTTDPDPIFTSTTSIPITTTDAFTMTTEDVTLSTTVLPTTTSSPEENFTISAVTETTVIMQTPTTIPPTTVPPTTTLQVQVSSTTPRLPLHIRKAKAFYLPAQDIPSSLPTTAVFLTPPPPPPNYPGPTPPQFFPTMSTIYDNDPLKEYINQNLQNNIVTLHDDTDRSPYLNIQNPNLNHPQATQSNPPNIEAYYASPNFNGSPPVQIAQFDPMIYEALQAAFHPGHGTHIDNGVYFFETSNPKRKRSQPARIPLKDFRARSRRFHKVKGFTAN